MIFYYKNLKIDYDIIGSGPPILFLHGWGGDKNSLITLAQYLRNNRIYTISMPDQLKEAWTVKDYSALIADFLLFVDVKKPDVVCHSFGGRIVLEMPETFNKIVFIDSAGLKSKFSIKKKIKIYYYKLQKKLVRLGIKKEQSLDKFGSNDYKNLSPIMKQTFVNIVNYHQNKLIKNIKNNVLIIWGRYDKDTPLYMAKKLSKNIKNSQLKIYNGGHFCYLQHIEDIGIAIQNFLCD